MKIKKSTRLYIMIALISALSSISTVCLFEYIRTPPTAAYADERQLEKIIDLLKTIKDDVKAFKWEYLKKF